MRAWGAQGFLNEPSSDDSGWFKFSVRPSHTPHDIGFSYVFKLADCSQHIDLDFWTDKAHRLEDGTYRDRDLNNTRKAVKRRLKKVRLLRRQIVAAMDKFEEALLETDRRAVEELEKNSRATIEA